MTIVLIHGVPETPAVWDRLAGELTRCGLAEPVRLTPPGFGAPVPVGFGCTPAAYQLWLSRELSEIPQPVDLVGHDWGGLHVARFVMANPGLVRSWASDAIGVFDWDYQWHALARVWQTRGNGETWVADQLAKPVTDRAADYLKLGMDPVTAQALAEAFDPTMGDAILRLYRGAAQPMMRWLGQNLETASRAPGLAVIATGDDTVGTVRQRRGAASRSGATVAEVDAGHWWMTEQSGPAAELLGTFWSALP